MADRCPRQPPTSGPRLIGSLLGLFLILTVQLGAHELGGAPEVGANSTRALLELAVASLARNSPLEVLCNSRASCVIHDITQRHHQPARPPLNLTHHSLATKSTSNESGASQLVSTFSLFDYELDYDQEPRPGGPLAGGHRVDQSSPAAARNASDVHVDARQAQLPLMGVVADPLPATRNQTVARLTSGPDSQLNAMSSAANNLGWANERPPTVQLHDRLAALHQLRNELPAGTAQGGVATPGPTVYAHHHHLPGAYLRRLGLPSQIAANNELAAATPAPSHPIIDPDARLLTLSQLDLSAKLRLQRPGHVLDQASIGAAAAKLADPDQERKGSPNDAELDSPDTNSAGSWNESLQLLDQVSQLLADLESTGAQSLRLSFNEMQFELWSELYALLALPFRHQILQLDLSHNSLTKLGVTFTGYIERHLALRQLSSWPFTSSNQESADNTPLTFISGRSRTRYSIGNGGRLYNAVFKRHLERLNSLSTASPNASSVVSANHNSHNATQQLANLLQQTMLVRSIDLSHNKLKWLISDQFRAIKLVQTIRLDYNRIRYIHQHAFNGLELLRHVNLNSNKLQVIYIEQFQSNFKLSSLVLRSNYISYLRGGTFGSLSNLRRLDLSQNKLTVLSNNAFLGLSSLELLNLSSNQFVNVPSSSLHPLTSIRLLDLSSNLIAQLAPGTFFHLSVEELSLSNNNQLVDIERGAFIDLARFERLHLSSNPLLMSIDSQAFVCTQNLKYIDIENCTSLERSAKQLLENITSAANYRMTQKSKQPFSESNLTNPAEIQPSALIWDLKGSGLDLNANMSREAIEMALVRQQSPLFGSGPSARSLAKGSEFNQHLSEILMAHQGKLRYVYYLGTVTLLAIALKLVLKFSSSQRYLDTRRRRRKVYEASASISPESSCATRSQSSYSNDAVSYNEDVVIQLLESRPRSLSWSLDKTAISTTSISHNNFSSSYGSIPMRYISNHHQDSASLHAVGQQATTTFVNSLDLATDMVLQSHDYDPNISVIEKHINAVQSQEAVVVSACCLMANCNQNQVTNEQACYSHPACSVNCDATQVSSNYANSQNSLVDSMDLLHNQMVASSLDYDHTNCSSFCQSLGPGLHIDSLPNNYADYY